MHLVHVVLVVYVVCTVIFVRAMSPAIKKKPCRPQTRRATMRFLLIEFLEELFSVGGIRRNILHIIQTVLAQKLGNQTSKSVRAFSATFGSTFSTALFFMFFHQFFYRPTHGCQALLCLLEIPNSFRKFIV